MEIKLTNNEFFVEGMHCASCGLLIESKISTVNGIKKVDVKLNENKVYIQSEKRVKADKLSKLVEEFGYKILETESEKNFFDKKNLILGFFCAAIIFSLFLLLQSSEIINLVSNEGQITLSLVFLIGVIASLSTCMAIVGGLVLSISSSYAKNHQNKPILFFHISRLISFFLLGGLIGFLGSAFVLSAQMTFVLNLVLFFVMLILAINLLGVLPFTKNLQIRMPKFIGRKTLTASQTNNFLTPILLGAGTFFLPCGFTQSMQLYSLTTGNFLNGAVTMTIFALGTFPVLTLISFASTKFAKGFKSDLFFKTAGFIIIFFAIFNFLGMLRTIGIYL